MSEDRVRRIVREEIAMTLVKIVRKADSIYAICDHDDPRNDGLMVVRDVVNAVAEDMVSDLAESSGAKIYHGGS